MSIPKEPRQLMINLMYLVLTALLALNVSAEVMNAFFSLDKGMKKSGSIVDANNDAIKASIEQTATAYPTPRNDSLKNKATEVIRLTKEFNEYIDKVRTDLFAAAKGPSKDDPEIPQDIRNKDLTTRMFINEGLGAQIEQKIKDTRAALLNQVEPKYRAEIEKAIPLDVEAIPENIRAKYNNYTWADYKFKSMPVAAVFPTLGKMQEDGKSSASAVLASIAKSMNANTIVFDEFQPGISAEKSYIIAGEKYVADVFLSAYSSSASNITITAGGQNLPIKEGVGHYEISPSGLGEKTYTVSISVLNPLDNTRKTYTKDFKYEVGQRSIAVSLDQMNVFYIGVDNPVSVSVAGASSNQVNVNGSGVSVKSSGGGKYIVTATTPGEATLTVSAPGVSQTFKYRVKRIPDPEPLLGAQHTSKMMGNGEFKAQSGIAAVLKNFDFNAKCEIVGFTLTYLKKRSDPTPEIPNSGARFGAAVEERVRQAGPGDAYFFDNIKCKCPGDAVPRPLPGLTFRIK